MSSGEPLSSEDRAPVGYMKRTRDFYRALGYETDYVWARFEDVPFARPEKPVAETRLAIVTTSSPMERAEARRAGIKEVWSDSTVEPPAALFTDNVSWAKESTHTDDRESFVPIDALERLIARGRLGALADRFHGIPTRYSQRETREIEAPEILRRCREDGAEAALLIPL